ncbi:hypothetical protein EDB89DRAFT_1909193 [Lactarius sanguifluus]|nr:hypothetical protein EDB89DRAFT_1909193 [Lactarius sanguifluus]
MAMCHLLIASTMPLVIVPVLSWPRPLPSTFSPKPSARASPASIQAETRSFWSQSLLPAELLSLSLNPSHRHTLQQIPQPEKTASCPISNDLLDVCRVAHLTMIKQQATAVMMSVGILQIKPKAPSHPRAACATNCHWCPAIAGPVVATMMVATVPMEGTPSMQPWPQLQDDDNDDDKTVLTMTMARRC